MEKLRLLLTYSSHSRVFFSQFFEAVLSRSVCVHGCLSCVSLSSWYELVSFPGCSSHLSPNDPNSLKLQQMDIIFGWTDYHFPLLYWYFLSFATKKRCLVGHFQCLTVKRDIYQPTRLVSIRVNMLWSYRITLQQQVDHRPPDSASVNQVISSYLIWPLIVHIFHIQFFCYKVANIQRHMAEWCCSTLITKHETRLWFW